ncbi:carboxypeptidase regulatory-like domain-containing protein [Variovorax guangxiensis]|uniref:Carboxypeptidase regulatory-like domain-containing protein n=1 Tax=Variovorax guangxiensis TaxID=1775474 RepID=A0A502DER8_9BURK|nr:MAG: carboxypeptidase regulatory-like domain-containing protein [Variovorax sp.]TPG18946.1 carboxypeptidase regulatory-like domain-containing protein [Variovorax ginsengisoli]TPG23778.1 carboxypeptidase regulatory-like domain-containing protein [Variovorax guangxiensis]
MFHSSRPSLFAARGLLAMAALCAGSAALAQVPPMQGEGAARYACGGIGSDESTAMRAAMKSHPLSLLFARPDGGYLADVAVKLTDASGASALSLRAGGPVCLIDLPAGNYTVEATSEGVSKRQTVSIGSTPRTLDFRF